MDVRTAMAEALGAWQELTGGDATAAAWEAPSVLEGYTVGGLVAHVAMGVQWLLVTLDTEAGAGDVDVLRPGHYFATMKIEPEVPPAAFHAAVVAAGEDRARHGAAATAERTARTAEALLDRLAEEDLERLVDLRPTLPHAMQLGDFATTRVVELVVHGDDLAVSLGLDGLDPGWTAARVCADVLTSTAAVQHTPLAVVRALSRAERSAPGVVPVF